MRKNFMETLNEVELARVANSPLSTFMRALEEGEERADIQSLPPSENSEENG